jgi:hypothetical protein
VVVVGLRVELVGLRVELVGLRVVELVLRLTPDRPTPDRAAARE